MYWGARAKVNWLKWGDRNSSISMPLLSKGEKLMSSTELKTSRAIGLIIIKRSNILSENISKTFSKKVRGQKKTKFCSLSHPLSHLMTILAY